MCASSPASTATSGARLRPWAATFQPARASTCWRAAARQVVLAICPPVTIPIPVPAGSPNSPVNQAITVSSTTAAAGESTKRPAFWSHALVSQSAPTAAGRLPPITKPKNRGPAVPTNPGSARFASSSITRPAGSPCSGSGPPRAARIASGPAAAPTGRPLTPSRNRTAAACAASRAVRSMPHPTGVARVGPNRYVRPRSAKHSPGDAMAVWYAFGLLAGMAQALQAAVNAQLRAAVQSPLWAALISFVVGTLGLALLVLATRASIPAQWPSRPWVWSGGLLGVLYVCAAILLLPRLGAGTMLALFVAGQMSMALVLDHFGLLGVPVHTTSPGRLLGALLVVAGVILLRRA